MKTIFGIFEILRSNDHPRQLAWGIAFGMMLGFIPAKSLLGLILLISLYFLNINLGVALLTAMTYKIAGAFLSPLFHEVGRFWLLNESLKPMWTMLYNMPVIPLTKFNNTVVCGAVFISLILLIPHYFLATWLVRQYQRHTRKKIEDALNRIGWYQVAKRSQFVQKMVNAYKTYQSVKSKLS